MWIRWCLARCPDVVKPLLQILHLYFLVKGYEGDDDVDAILVLIDVDGEEVSKMLETDSKAEFLGGEDVIESFAVLLAFEQMEADEDKNGVGRYDEELVEDKLEGGWASRACGIGIAEE